GLYLILTGLGRFVEEAYRGEVQTMVVWGLRIYQWIAIASVILGMAMSIIRIDHIEITPGFGWDTLFAALIGGLFIGCAMGVDFPLSDRRFSRLV
ncbi:MAG: diacylglyceryl transferase, partial [Bacteroidota bacterium]|nr:diacylglyceryl transferase [Bacteroidota bacterium]